MVTPNQFQVNEAWIAFKLNDAPISTQENGDFNIVALMDAASCFILGSELIPVASADLTRDPCHRLLENAERNKKQLPTTLFAPGGEVADLITREATQLNIDVVEVSESELLIFIGEARQGFSEQFEGTPQ